MALNFPSNPNTNDTYTSGNSTWQWDGTSWNLLFSAGDGIANFPSFRNISADTGVTVPTEISDTLTIAGGDKISTLVTGKEVSIDFTGNIFNTIVGDAGSATPTLADDTLRITGTNGIATSINAKNVSIGLSSNLSIDNLGDVDTTTTTPEAGQVLKWNGTKWVPGIDATTGGAGTDADTLDGFDSSYFLNYNNLSNTPIVPTALTDLGISDGENGQALLTDGNGTFAFQNLPTAQNIFASFIADSGTIAATTTNSVLTVSGGTGIETAITGNTLTITNTGGASGGVTAFKNIAVAGQSTVQADTAEDTLTLVAGTNVTITTNANTDTITINSSGGGGTQNLFSTIAVAGQDDVIADDTTDILTLQNGTGIAITTDADNDTITISSTVGSPDLADIAEFASASLTIDKVYLQAITRLTVDNVSASAYTFDQYTGNNPTIYAISGTTIAFDLDAISGHPFAIQDGTATNYNTGLVHVATNGTVSTGAAAQGQTAGTLYWKIPAGISGNYIYQCLSHAPMVGTITIKNIVSI